jgi:hypothetical protein
LDPCPDDGWLSIEIKLPETEYHSYPVMTTRGEDVLIQGMYKGIHALIGKAH